MKIIKTLSEKISEEIHDAKEYAKLALEVRETYPELARTLFDLSNEEMGHMPRLHDAVAGVIKKYRDEKGEPPAAMLAVYDYLHNQAIEKAAKVKNLQEMFKEN